VQINIYRNFSRKIVERIESGALDVGVVTLPVRSPSLKVHPIFRDRLMVMVSPSHLLAKHPAVTVEEIAQHPLIFPKTGYTRLLLDKLFRPYREQLRVTMELPSVGMIKNFVAAGLGATLISASFAQNEARAGQVVLIPLKGVELWRELGLIYRKDRSLPRAALAFIALVRQRTAAAAAAARAH
jgi:DNA-binding transcriptional LysR family regulator